MYIKPAPKTSLEKIFFDDIEKETPPRIKNNMLFDLNNDGAYVFRLKREHLSLNTDDTRPLAENEIRSPEGLGIYEWFKNYEKEANVSTAGIRGLQNPLYPWDTRYPMNIVGIVLATLGKALVLKELYGVDSTKLYKLVASEVRYNSGLYVDLIARVQAAQGIKTYRTPINTVIPIWMTSFLIFTEDFVGGEYVTSSHALSKKIATKDLNFQGGQFIPAESSLFVAKIKQILNEVESKGYYEINIAGVHDKLINPKYIVEIGFGINKYINYLKTTVASDQNLKLFAKTNGKIVIDCMGGSMQPTLDSLFRDLDIVEHFDFINGIRDPFFHEIGKTVTNAGKIDDLGCDSSIVKFDLVTGKYTLPVVNTMKYREKLADYDIGTLLLITDPDGDRLITAQVNSIDQKPTLDELGVLNVELTAKKMLAVYLPNQSFLMTFDFQKAILEQNGLWQKYDWFIIKTTASAMSWGEWAKYNNVPVINVPVGFKEIATILQKVEAKLEISDGTQDIIIKDVFGVNHNLGKNPRLLFAGEESGGEIFGPTELIKSRNGKIALAMREKSAGEAILITSMMYCNLAQNKKLIHQYLSEIFEKNKINGRFDVRVDQKYYNESEPDIAKLQIDKQNGIQIRTKNDMYFLSIALSYRLGKLTMQQVKEILIEVFPTLDFTDLLEISFVGDGTYLRFSKKYVEVRPSGTDAINKAYSAGNNWQECVKYSQAFAGYTGERNPKHLTLIPREFYDDVKPMSLKLLMEFQQQDLPKLTFVVPSDLPK